VQRRKNGLSNADECSDKQISKLAYKRKRDHARIFQIKGHDRHSEGVHEDGHDEC